MGFSEAPCFCRFLPVSLREVEAEQRWVTDHSFVKRLSLRWRNMEKQLIQFVKCKLVPSNCKARSCYFLKRLAYSSCMGWGGSAQIASRIVLVVCINLLCLMIRDELSTWVLSQRFCKRPVGSRICKSACAENSGTCPFWGNVGCCVSRLRLRLLRFNLLSWTTLFWHLPELQPGLSLVVKLSVLSQSWNKMCLLWVFGAWPSQAFKNNEGILLYGGDILGYLLALTADEYGRNNVQAG